MNMETRHALARFSASLVALTNHVEAGQVRLGNLNPSPEGLTNLRSEEDPRKCGSLPYEDEEADR